LSDILKRVAYVTVTLYRVPTGKFMLQFGALFRSSILLNKAINSFLFNFAGQLLFDIWGFVLVA